MVVHILSPAQRAALFDPPSDIAPIERPLGSGAFECADRKLVFATASEAATRTSHVTRMLLDRGRWRA